MTHSEPAEAVALLPCPFCGEKAEIERYGDRRQTTIYHCTSCSCSLETGEEWGHGSDWNRRASPAPAAGGLEAILSTYEAETRALPLGAASREKGDSAYNWRMSVVKDLRELAARLASPAAPAESAQVKVRRNDPFRPAVDVDADDDYYPAREED